MNSVNTGAGADWLPTEIAILLSHESPETRAAADVEARTLGQWIFESAYNSNLQSILSSGMAPLQDCLPRESLAPLEFCGDMLKASRRELEDEARKEAAHAAKIAVQFWALHFSSRLAGPIGSSELCLVLIAAVKELRDTEAALASVTFWTRNQAPTLPPNWHQVHRCLQKSSPPGEVTESNPAETNHDVPIAERTISPTEPKTGESADSAGTSARKHDEAILP